jgi:hypothetical protein
VHHIQIKISIEVVNQELAMAINQQITRNMFEEISSTKFNKKKETLGYPKPINDLILYLYTLRMMIIDIRNNE